MKKKTILCIVISLVLVFISVLAYETYTRNRYNIPESHLNSNATVNTYTPDNALPRNLLFERYSIDVPDAVLKSVEDGEAFTISRESAAFVYSTDSVLEIKDIAESCFNMVDIALNSTTVVILEETGYLNGFSMTYFAVSKGHYILLGYRLNTETERNILYATVSNRPTTEDLNTCSNALNKMIMATTIPEKDEIPVAEVTGENYEYYNRYSEYENYEQIKEGTAPIHVRKTQKYTQRIYADKDFKQLRLTLRWMDTSVEPWELELYDNTEESVYEPVSTEPGEYVYIIDDVQEGDSFVFHFWWRNPGGISITQEEESEYEDYFLDD